MVRILEGQVVHLGALVGCAMPLEGSFLGLSAEAWLWLAVAAQVVHQVYVWFGWRTQLHHGLPTRWFGDRAFPVFRAGFVVLILSRPIALLAIWAHYLGTERLDMRRFHGGGGDAPRT